MKTARWLSSVCATVLFCVAAAAADDPVPAAQPRAEGERPGEAGPFVERFLQRAVELVQGKPQPTTPAIRRRTPAVPASSQSASTDDLLKRIDETSRELKRLGLIDTHVPAAQRPSVHVLLESVSLGLVQGRPDARRFVAAQLRLVNLTSDELVLKRDDVELVVNGNPRKLAELSDRIRSQGVRVGSQYHPLGSLTTPERLSVPEGGSALCWLVFGDLAAESDVPRMIVRWTSGSRTIEADLNQLALAALRMDVERIGPRDCLGLLTIGGELNAVNAGDLVQALETLADANVSRAVIRWQKGATPVDHDLWNWLQQLSLRAGQGGEFHDRYPHLPSAPAAIRSLHLVSPVESQHVATHYHNGVPLRALVHKSDLEAVEAALESVYDAIPPDELMREVVYGHPLTRAAALAGGGRLPVEYLPQVLAYADSDDPHLQKAALIALAGFGERKAVERLASVARGPKGSLSATAIESLAASRFAAAHRALLELLRDEDEETRLAVVKVLAIYPRPIWSDVLYEFAQQRDSALGVDALRALMAIGHPRLNELLERALREGSDSVKQDVFNLLATRDDPDSERLALDYTLASIEHREPTSQMYQLLQRTKDQRAVRLLVKRLDGENNRTALINVLGQIGDQSVADALADQYAKLKPHEQAAALNAMVQLQSPRFRELAARALHSNEPSLISAACQGLIADGSEEAVRLLVKAFEDPKNERGWSFLANALGTVGTSAAREALLRARDSTNANRRNFAANALQNLRQRSPGYHYLIQGQQHARQGQWKEAAQQYGNAVKMDPDLAEAWSGRGSALLNLGKQDQAKKDFERASQLDPYNSQAITGTAIVRILKGEVEGGIQWLEASRERFKNFDQTVFAYNAACVYSQAYGKVPKNDARAERYKEKAVEELQRAIKAGYQDFDLMRNDPDMKPLHEVPEFQKLVPKAPDAPQNARIGRAPLPRPIAVPAGN